MIDTLANMAVAILIGFVIFMAIYAVACLLTGRKM